ncbi:MAG: L-seryl-tRNA(Sec) selenium transferase [Desulfobacterales bacterium]|nr:L-seryl-tRNA(Sec) selenium transferase [Desulfobacterales bacterium]
MESNNDRQQRLRSLPGVDRLLAQTDKDPFFKTIPKPLTTRVIRGVLEDLRSAIMAKDPSAHEDALTETKVIERVCTQLQKALEPNLKPLVNATGIVVHTNLGRSLLAEAARENVARMAGAYSNLEFDLEKSARGSRYTAVEGLICEISGAEAAMAVNNNAGAVLLCLDTIASSRQVIVSRGELVEIGGSFRIPDVMAKSGARLREVGTTNRTHPRDYEQAICDETGLLLKVHTSNFAVVGFTASVSLTDLVALGRKYRLPVMEDLGSGTFVDFSRYGLMKEPTVQESVATGIDVVTFSGDKLLGGPQAGIIAGKRELIDAVKKNPLTRALRIDKMTLAALEATLRLYRNESEAVRSIPTLRMLTRPLVDISADAEDLARQLQRIDDPRLSVELADRTSRAGGGSLPLLDLPTKSVDVHIQGVSVNTLERHMRNNRPPIIGRIESDRFVMDPRTIQSGEFSIIENALSQLLKRV